MHTFDRFQTVLGTSKVELCVIFIVVQCTAICVGVLHIGTFRRIHRKIELCLYLAVIGAVF